MSQTLSIPGVSLEVFKEGRRLDVEKDGFVGSLHSGSATVLAVIDPSADETLGIRRGGDDSYALQWDWLVDPDSIETPFLREQQARRQKFLDGRSFAEGSRLYGVHVPLRVNYRGGQPVNTVHYPENMLMLAQYVREMGKLTGRVHVWKVALVSQNENFFLTVDRHYNMPACRGLTGRTCFVRIHDGHPQLEKLLVSNRPRDLPLVEIEQLVSLPPTEVPQLNRYEGIVERWYAPRNMGCIMTSQGKARVHWSNIPARPRLRFLREGERVRFSELRKPERNPQTEYRKARSAQFKLEACGVEVV